MAVEDLPVIATKVSVPGFAAKKLQRAHTLTEELTTGVKTHTAIHLFDGAVKQAYMENSLRGGMPLVLGDLDDSMCQANANEDSRLKVYHVYSCIHGDLEREYNDFVIDPTYFSQGPGNFRNKLGWGLKFQGRLLEAWMGVYQATTDLTLPYFCMHVHRARGQRVGGHREGRALRHCLCRGGGGAAAHRARF